MKSVKIRYIEREVLERLAYIFGPNSSAQKCLDDEKRVGRPCRFFAAEDYFLAIPENDLGGSFIELLE